MGHDYGDGGDATVSFDGAYGHGLWFGDDCDVGDCFDGAAAVPAAADVVGVDEDADSGAHRMLNDLHFGDGGPVIDAAVDAAAAVVVRLFPKSTYRPVHREVSKCTLLCRTQWPTDCTNADGRTGAYVAAGLSRLPSWLH